MGIQYPINVQKDTKLFKQIEFYIHKHIKNKNILTIEINRKTITYKFERESKRSFKIPFLEWKNGQVTKDIEVANYSDVCNFYDKIITKTLEEFLDDYKDVIDEILPTFRHKEKIIMFNVKGLVRGRFSIPYSIFNKTFDKEKVKNIFLKHLISSIKSKFKDTLNERKNIIQKTGNEFARKILETFVAQYPDVFSVSETSLKNNDMLINFNGKFLNSHLVLNNYIDDFEFSVNIFRDIKYISANLTEKGLSSIVSKLNEKLESGLYINVSEDIYKSLQEPLTEYASYVYQLYTGKSDFNKHIDFCIKHINGEFIIFAENSCAIAYLKNNEVVCKYKDVSNNDKYRESIIYTHSILFKYLFNIEFVSGKGLLNGTTFVYFNKENKQIPLMLESCSYEKDEWKNLIDDVLYDIKACSEFGYSNIEYKTFCRCTQPCYAGFMEQDILRFISMNENITIDEIIQCMRGLKFSNKKINKIDNYGAYKELDETYIEERLYDSLKEGYVYKTKWMNDNKIYDVYEKARKSSEQLNPKIIPENLNFFMENDIPLTCFELAFITDCNEKSNLHWLTLLEQGLTNIEFLCVCQEEFIECFTDADEMFIQILKMKLENDTYKTTFQKKIVKEIFKKWKEKRKSN